MHQIQRIRQRGAAGPAGAPGYPHPGVAAASRRRGSEAAQIRDEVDEVGQRELWIVRHRGPSVALGVTRPFHDHRVGIQDRLDEIARWMVPSHTGELGPGRGRRRELLAGHGVARIAVVLHEDAAASRLVAGWGREEPSARNAAAGVEPGDRRANGSGRLLHVLVVRHLGVARRCRLAQHCRAGEHRDCQQGLGGQERDEARGQPSASPGRGPAKTSSARRKSRASPRRRRRSSRRATTA